MKICDPNCIQISFCYNNPESCTNAIEGFYRGDRIVCNNKNCRHLFVTKAVIHPYCPNQDCYNYKTGENK